MKKIIIRNHTNISDWLALSLVAKVVDKWFISWKDDHYCYATRFSGEDDSVAIGVFVTKNKTWFTFIIQST